MIFAQTLTRFGKQTLYHGHFIPCRYPIFKWMLRGAPSPCALVETTLSHRLAKEMEAMKYRDAGVVFRQPFAILGSVSEALRYATAADQPEVVNRFMESYHRLPELLKAQQLNEAQRAAFLQAIDWKE